MEVCLGQRWGTVCDNEWSTANAVVLCLDGERKKSLEKIPRTQMGIEPKTS